MSDSKLKKIVDQKSMRGIALDDNSIAGAERALRNKTANLSVAGAATRLSNVTPPAAQGTKPQASSTSEPQTIVPARKLK